MNFALLDSTWKLVDSIIHRSSSTRLGSTWLYMGVQWRINHGSGWLSSTSPRADFAPHRPRPTPLHIDQGQLRSTLIELSPLYNDTGRLRSILARADLARHRPGLTSLNIGPGQLRSTFARVDSTRRRPRQTPLTIDPGRLRSTST